MTTLQTSRRCAALQGAAGQQGAVLPVGTEVLLSQPAGGVLQEHLHIQTESGVPTRAPATGWKHTRGS